jgi:hypothetical protein
VTTATAVEKPKRIQRKRTKGWTMPPNTVYVGRPSDFGNPFVVGDPVYSQAAHFDDDSSLSAGSIWVTEMNCPLLFRVWAEQMSTSYPAWLDRLRGKSLACWCKEGDPCHADILLELANQ